MSRLAVILPAAGASSRFGTDKLSQKLGGRSVLDLSISAFLQRKDVELVIVALASDAKPPMIDSRLLSCIGGATRAETVLAALNLVPQTIEWVAIHDAARPLVTQQLIDRTLTAAIEFGCAVPALPVNLTIKQAPSPLPSGVLRTIPRGGLFAMQTPQIMRRADLVEAFRTCPIQLSEITDDAQLVELSGKPVRLVVGDERNIKITTPLDLTIAQAILNASGKMQ